jgi:hypothetical protein
VSDPLPADCPALVLFRLPTGIVLNRLPRHEERLKGGLSRREAPYAAVAFRVPPSRDWRPVSELPPAWGFTTGPTAPVWDEEDEADWRHRHGLA